MCVRACVCFPTASVLGATCPFWGRCEGRDVSVRSRRRTGAGGAGGEDSFSEDGSYSSYTDSESDDGKAGERKAQVEQVRLTRENFGM